ncbi:MAG: YbhB/YbcL family Raf kinase inhibitor-like protein [Actinomycetota bacterium]
MAARRTAALLVTAALALAACGGEDPPPSAPEDLEVTSPAFPQGGEIPVEFTCDGDEVSPPLLWSGVPDGTAELAVIATDPDAPGGTFVHWVLLHVPATITSLETGAAPGESAVGLNSTGEAAYGGPCPPEGDDPHRYRFTVYALSRVIDAGDEAGYDEVRGQIADAALAEGTLEGRYGR